MGSAKIIALTSAYRSRSKSLKLKGEGEPSVVPEDALLYTLDLLMEDFGKKHLPKYCVLCEPMKVMGKHRDAVMVDLLHSLFITFFPSFSAYLSEVRDNLLRGLLERGQKRSFDSLKDKLQALLREQIAADLKDFFGDLRKHLLKHTGVKVDAAKESKIISKVMDKLQAAWIG
jgi:hypothetical protein